MNEEPPAAVDGSSSPRRSGRSRVSTTMKIQGHTVLRKNNYKVVGMQYVYDEHQEDAPKEPCKKKPKTTLTQQKKQVQTREETPGTVKRRKHNQFVDDCVKRKGNLRRTFLTERLDLLRPFLEDKVLDSLVKVRESEDTANNETKTKAEIKPVKQPKMIEKATLRPYQLKGLEFMVRMNEKNLAMILGDEMGLVGIVSTRVEIAFGFMSVHWMSPLRVEIDCNVNNCWYGCEFLFCVSNHSSRP